MPALRLWFVAGCAAGLFSVILLGNTVIAISPFELVQVILAFFGGQLHDEEDSEETPRVAEEDLSARNQTAQHQMALQAFLAGDVRAIVQVLQTCEATDGGCYGVRGAMAIVGLGVSRNVSESLVELHRGAMLGDVDSTYSLGVLYSNIVEAVAATSPAEDVDIRGILRRSGDLAVLHLYAASLGGHPGALMAMGYRHTRGLGVQKSCSAAALNYLEVARRVSDVYSSGMPQAVELVRLGVGTSNSSSGFGGDRRAVSIAEASIFVQLAASGDINVAAAVGKRYLLGVEGFRQSYRRAAQYLQIAGNSGHAAAQALLGYMYSLGLSVPKDLEKAHSCFKFAAQLGDPGGHNGLGYLHFHGSPTLNQSFPLAVFHFNVSAYLGSADGMFNLAACYMSGLGVARSFSHAVQWFTMALDRGHTPAAYALAIMHLNGIGTGRNCENAVMLLKRVCERGGWVAHQLQQAYEHHDREPNLAAWLYLRLAEAGHEVAQMNFAHLLDSGRSELLLDEGKHNASEAKALARVLAQRHYEMAADQGNVPSELRLGDYAYYGWGLRADDGHSPSKGPSTNASESPVDEDALDREAEARLSVGPDDETLYVLGEADVAESLVRYQRTAETRTRAPWMEPSIARAWFNLGVMRQFGIGVHVDMALARYSYQESLQADPSGVHLPVLIMQCILFGQALMEMWPSLLGDIRVHILVVQVVAILVLLLLRERVLAIRAPAARVAA